MAQGSQFILTNQPRARWMRSNTAHLLKRYFFCERTLLVSGMLESCLTSKVQGHARLETPHLSVSYKAPKESQFPQS